jgi:hypothetical protein
MKKLQRAASLQWVSAFTHCEAGNVVQSALQRTYICFYMRLPCKIFKNIFGDKIKYVSLRRFGLNAVPSGRVQEKGIGCKSRTDPLL